VKQKIIPRISCGETHSNPSLAAVLSARLSSALAAAFPESGGSLSWTSLGLAGHRAVLLSSL